MHPFRHFRTITKHKNRVMKYCFKCGLYRQGLAHDMSKYGITEFSNGAKYYLGTKSPHLAERESKGYSDAWMHHKGRNKHHVEYWIDFDVRTMRYDCVDMPNRYLAESICDRLAATEIYNGKNAKPEGAYLYYLKEGDHVPMSKNTRMRMEYLLKYYIVRGPKETFRFIRKNMRNNKTEIPMEESVHAEFKDKWNL